MGNSMYRFLSGGYEYLILLHGLFQLPYQIRCLAFVSFDALCITVYDDIGNDQQQKDKSHQAAYLHKRLFTHSGYFSLPILQVSLYFLFYLEYQSLQLPVKFNITSCKAIGLF